MEVECTIKFRGKREDEKDSNFVVGDYIYDNVTGNHFIVVDFHESMNEDKLDLCAAIRINPETIGLFTGLKDKNGKEVYDGDRYFNPESKLEGRLFYTNTATGGYELWCEEYDENKVTHTHCPFGNLDLTGFEVIGNIHTE